MFFDLSVELLLVNEEDYITTQEYINDNVFLKAQLFSKLHDYIVIFYDGELPKTSRVEVELAELQLKSQFLKSKYDLVVACNTPAEVQPQFLQKLEFSALKQLSASMDITPPIAAILSVSTLF